MRRSSLVAVQLVAWLIYGGIYYFTLRPYQPFADILWKQTLLVTAAGLACSTLLSGVYRAVGLRRMAPLGTVVTGLVGGSAAGVGWYWIKAWGTDWVSPFIAPVLRSAQVRPGDGSLLSMAPAFPVVMVVWSAVYVGVVHWREQRRQERRRLSADADAQRARLRMLRYQLNPHFFFNALNTIGALADEAPGRVKHVVRELSGFLRYTLLDDDTDAVPLRDEIDAAEHYLAVENIRFEDDLQVEVDVSEEAARRMVPAFLVLPLVENAVKHGQRTSPMPLRIVVTGRYSDEGLRVEVANTGELRDASYGADGTDTGLQNVRARLEGRYPEAHAFSLEEEDGWVRARIQIRKGVSHSEDA